MISQALFRESSGLVQDWMKGKFSTKNVCDLMGARTGHDRLEMMAALLDGFKNWSVSEELLTQLEKIRANGDHLFLVSDNMDVVLHWLYISGTADYFDDVWFSCDHGSLKAENSGIAYLSLATKWGVDISDCVLFDDDLKPIEIFEALGGQAQHVASPIHTLKLLHGVKTNKLSLAARDFFQKRF